MNYREQNLAALNAMAENVSDILESVNSIHGPTYHDMLICLLGGMAAVTQLAQIAEDAVDYISAQDNESARTVALNNRDIITLNLANHMRSMEHVCAHLEPTMIDIGKNLKILMERVQNDFFSKIDRSAS